MPVWLKEKLLLKSALQDELVSLDGVKKSGLPPVLFGEHHESHAASVSILLRFNPRWCSAWTAWGRVGDHVSVNTGRGMFHDSGPLIDCESLRARLG